MIRSRQIRTILTFVALGVLVALAPAGPASAALVQERASVRVVHGDTLSGIAARYCGAASAWPSVWAANRSKIANPDLIYPGQIFAVACTSASRSTLRTAPAVPPDSATGWVHPIRNGLRAISCWGAPRKDHKHAGVDLSAPQGTPIRAAHAGVVVAIRYQAGRAGWYVMLDHGVNQTVYMHMRARTPLRLGARVTAGATIGYVGATGNAEGPHLHFEVHRGAWHPIDPAPFMRAHGVSVGC